MENLRHIIERINKLNSRTIDVRVLGNEEYLEDCLFIENAINTFAENLDSDNENYADINFEELLNLANELKKRYDRDYIRRSSGNEISEDAEIFDDFN